MTEGKRTASCSICGRSVSGDSVQCSVACALASKIPTGGDGPLPATWPLAAAAGFGFALFNQALLASMAWVKLSQGNLEHGQRFAVISVVLGVVWLAAALSIWVRERPKRKRDGGTFIVALAGAAILLGYSPDGIGIAFPMLFFNFLISFNLGRGVYTLWRASKKREN
ncbi:MAG: hypothetical protein CBD18_01535 [Opitutales bacterium TMED158]|nr:MAG: hypothetical protein CBD18_01535 [Opitutales bacterium TMED158]